MTERMPMLALAIAALWCGATGCARSARPEQASDPAACSRKPHKLLRIQRAATGVFPDSPSHVISIDYSGIVSYLDRTGASETSCYVKQLGTSSVDDIVAIASDLEQPGRSPSTRRAGWTPIQ